MLDPTLIDLRHAGRRLRNRERESFIRESVCAEGIKENLIGVKEPDGSLILLDGFKRYRAALAVRIPSVSFEALGGGEREGIIYFIRKSLGHGLNILEQAAFILYLGEAFKITDKQLSAQLGVSRGWISMRRRLLSEMSDFVREKLFKGDFPPYSYMYHLSRFIRMNETSSGEVDDFVKATSGKHLSIREIEKLMYGYFKGPPEFRRWIEEGKIDWALKKSATILFSERPSLTELENSIIANLEHIHQCMIRLKRLFETKSPEGEAFFAQANLLAGHILEDLRNFTKILEDFYVRSGNV